MPRRCVVGGCSNEKDESRNISIHRFPQDPKWRRIWEKWVQTTRAKWTVTKWSNICSAHFTEDSFEERPGLMSEMGIYISRKRILKPDATPSILPKSTGTESPDFASTPKRPRGAFLKRERARVSNTAGRFAHKDDPLQISAGRPAPTISPMSCVKHQVIVCTCIIIILSSVLFFLQYPKYDFANTLYAISPQMYVVVTCNCETYLSSLFCIIRCRNQIRVNIKLFVAAQLILI